MLLIFAAVILVAVRWPRRPGQLVVSTVYFNFVGFQNSTNGMFDAVFYVTNWPRENTGWIPEEVSYRQSNIWQTENNFPRTLGLVIQNQTNIMVSFRVPSTNVPMRTVTKLTSDPSAWKTAVNDGLRRFGVRMRPFPGRVRGITNEITSAKLHGN